MALARVDRLRFAYPDGEDALRGVSLAVDEGERVLLLGPSGCGKSTLIRALAGLVPHFHGGRFAGRVEVAGLDTRRHRPAELAGTVATVFQDPEDQVVMTVAENEVAFGLENVAAAPAEIMPRARAALAEVGAGALALRRTHELSCGELQRVCLASALALRPRLLLLDEPTSQLDLAGAESFFELLDRLPCAAVLSEQRPGFPLRWADRVVFMEDGRILLDAPRDDALVWLSAHRPLWLDAHGRPPETAAAPGPEVCRLDGVSFAYGDRIAVRDESLSLRRGEIVALTGPNGSGKTTLAKLAAGLLEPDAGTVDRDVRASYLSQDPGRYLVRERVDAEVALGADPEAAQRALAEVGLTGKEARHPRDLSSGERERMALACVLATEPGLLVLDEPTRGVDPARKAELAALLRARAGDRATLVVTHDVVFARGVADREVSLAPEREAILA